MSAETEAANPAQAPEGKYVYCIVESKEPRSFGPIGIGGRGVRRLVFGAHRFLGSCSTAREFADAGIIVGGALAAQLLSAPRAVLESSAEKKNPAARRDVLSMGVGFWVLGVGFRVDLKNNSRPRRTQHPEPNT